MLAAMAWQCISCIIYGVGCGYLATGSLFCIYKLQLFTTGITVCVRPLALVIVVQCTIYQDTAH